ncbi:MAG: hypothetical protein JW904_11075 [Spirochaetales bacterium]|nr:hypothetical protein [Spirochaetales bacterium]
MTFIELTNIIKKDIPIHYRREFTGSAVFATGEQEQMANDVHFVIEYDHSGAFDVRVNFIEPAGKDHHTAVVLLKKHIIELEKKGALKKY